jgi:pyruvate formate lyase activating enzyme
MNEFIHLEITNLLLPNENDSKDDIKHLVDFIANLNNEIPLHISRFYPNYRMKDKEATGIDKLLLAKEIAESAGLKYIYIGNTGLEKVSNTFCPNCNELLIKRNNYNIKFENMNLSKKQCKKCETKINLIL